jgi:hypothetical protein
MENDGVLNWPPYLQYEYSYQIGFNQVVGPRARPPARPLLSHKKRTTGTGGGGYDKKRSARLERKPMGGYSYVCNIYECGKKAIALHKIKKVKKGKRKKEKRKKRKKGKEKQFAKRLLRDILLLPILYIWDRAM